MARKTHKKNKSFFYKLSPKFLLRYAVIGAVWSSILLFLYLGWHALHLPDIKQLETSVRRPSIVFLASDRREIAVHGDVHGETITLKQVPQSLIDALLATEDHAFFSHWGINFKALMRATLKNLVAGRYVQGGSTITQQLAKNLFLTPKRSIHRKIKEMLLSFWLEHHFTKNQIMTIYLNRVFLGSQTYGVDAAAQQYFGKLVSHLNTAESAVIVALLKAPSRFGSNTELLKKRAAIVLSNMKEEGYLAEDAYQRACRQLEKIRFRKTKHGNKHRYFTDWIMEEVGQHVDANQDLIVTTTIDLNLQNIAIQKLKASIAQNGEKFNIETGAFLAMAYDGAVRSIIGGHDYNYNQFNTATQAKRQPGSIYKTFIFIGALEKGLTPRFELSDGIYRNKDWTVRNYGWKEKGTVTLEDTLVYSINTATVRIAQKVGVAHLVDVAERLGFKAPPSYNLSIALGTSETTLLELVQAFTMIANHGLQVEPYGVLEVRSANGEILYQRKPEKDKQDRVFDESIMETMEDMLEKSVDQGTSRKAQIPGVKACGKTGTTQKFRDAWFVGFVPGLVGGVWMGNLNDTPMNRVVGGKFPAQLWSDIMRHAQLKS